MSQFLEFVKSIEKNDFDAMEKTYHKLFLNRSILCDNNHKPIHLACEKGNVAGLKFLLDQGCEIETENKWGFKPIHLACKAGSADIVQILIDKGCDCQSLTSDNETPLHIACQYGHVDVIHLLLIKDCPIDVPGPWGFYPIHTACQYGQLEVLKLLMKHKCQYKPLTEFGYQPLHIACKHGQSEILNHFLALNFEICGQTEWSGEPIHLASQYGHVDILKILLDKKCPLDNLTRKGYTAMHFAAENDHIEIVKLLLIKGANANLINEEQKTPLQLANERQNEECESLLTIWFKNFKVVDSVKFSNLKSLKIICPTKLSELGYLFSAMLLDLSIDLKQDKITDFILKRFTKDMLSKTDLLAYRDSSNKSPSRIYQEYLVYESIKTNCEDIWNQLASIDLINGTCTPLQMSFIELAAKYGNIKFLKLILQMIIEVDNRWNSAIQIALHSERREINLVIFNRIDYINTRKMAKMNRLHIAVDDNRPDVIKYLIKKNICNPDNSESYVGLPLHMAYAYGRIECIKILEHLTRNFNGTNMSMQNCLHISIGNGTIENVVTVLSKTENMKHRDIYGCTYLHNAIICNREDVVKELLNDKCESMIGSIYELVHAPVMDLNKIFNVSKDQYGTGCFTSVIPISNIENCFSLCLKIHGRLYKVLDSFLSKDTISNSLDGNSNTILHICAILHLSELCKTLIENGADILKENSKGHTALQEMFINLLSSVSKPQSMESVYKTLLVLVENGSDINTESQHEHMNSVQMALKFDDEMLLESIISFVSEVKISENDFKLIISKNWISALKKIIFCIPIEYLTEDLLKLCTKIYSSDILISVWNIFPDEIKLNCLDDLLYLTSSEEYEKAFKFFCLQKIPNPKYFTNGETILTILIKERKSPFYLYLLNSEICKNLIDIPNQNGWSALHLVSQQYNLELLEKVLDLSQNIDLENKDGDTPLAILLRNIPENENNQSVKLLIKLMVSKGVDIYRISSNGRPIIDSCRSVYIKGVFEEIKKSNCNSF